MEGQTDRSLSTWGGLIITLLIIGVAFGLVWLAISGIQKQQTKITALSVNAEESTFTQYDGAKIHGDEVLGAIKSLEGNAICVEVNNGKTTTQYLFKPDLTTEAAGKIANATDRSNSAYITPKAWYVGEIVRDSSTDVITTIKFTKQ